MGAAGRGLAATRGAVTGAPEPDTVAPSGRVITASPPQGRIDRRRRRPDPATSRSRHGEGLEAGRGRGRRAATSRFRATRAEGAPARGSPSTVMNRAAAPSSSRPAPATATGGFFRTRPTGAKVSAQRPARRRRSGGGGEDRLALGEHGQDGRSNGVRERTPSTAHSGGRRLRKPNAPLGMFASVRGVSLPARVRLGSPPGRRRGAVTHDALRRGGQLGQDRRRRAARRSARSSW